MASPPPTTALDQLAEVSRRTADAMESIRAELVAVRTRVESLEGRLDETQVAQRRSAEHAERLAAAVEQLKRFDAIGLQVETLREAHERTADRVQRVAADFARIDRVESALVHLRSELTKQLDEHVQAQRAQAALTSRQQAEASQATAREIGALADRLERVERLGTAVDGLRHHQHEILAELQVAEARVDDLAAADRAAAEHVAQVDQRATAELGRVAAAVAVLEGVVTTWGERIEGQTESVRAARGVADDMRAAAARIEQAHHATTEAQRVAEGRVESTLGDMRGEIEARWERFLADRERHWTSFNHALTQREGEQRAATTDALAELEARIETIREGFEVGLDVQAKDVAELQRLVNEFVRGLGEVVAASAEGLGSHLPSADPSAVSAERRQALRRALRARRGGAGG